MEDWTSFFRGIALADPRAMLLLFSVDEDTAVNFGDEDDLSDVETPPAPLSSRASTPVRVVLFSHRIVSHVGTDAADGVDPLGEPI
jgi:hypothetical protein